MHRRVTVFGSCSSYRAPISSVFAVFLIVTSSTLATVDERAGWSKLAPYPVPITNNAVASLCGDDGCTLYSFMGMTNPSDPKSISAIAYTLTSPGTGPWKRIADAPLLDGRAKIAASAIACGGAVYLIAGYAVTESGDEVSEHRLFRYDRTADAYVRLADVPTAVDDTVVGVYQDRYIYLVSGWHGPIHANTRAVQVYDTVTDKWHQATPLPIGGRFGHAGGLVDGRLVSIDGCADSKGFPLIHDTLVGVIDAEDVTAITWTTHQPSPFQPTYRAAASLGETSHGEIIFVGGTDNPYNYNGTGYDKRPSVPLGQVMRYEPRSDAWSVIEVEADTSHVPTMDHRGLARFDGMWVTVGGMTGAGLATTAVNTLTLTGQTPPAIPTSPSPVLLCLAFAMVAAMMAVFRRKQRRAAKEA